MTEKKHNTYGNKKNILQVSFHPPPLNGDVGYEATRVSPRSSSWVTCGCGCVGEWRGCEWGMCMINGGGSSGQVQGNVRVERNKKSARGSYGWCDPTRWVKSTNFKVILTWDGSKRHVCKTVLDRVIGKVDGEHDLWEGRAADWGCVIPWE